MATLGTDSNCLYNAVVGLPPISSSFKITLFYPECITASLANGNSRTNCIDIPFQQLTTISITPPWFYSYQCTSALLSNYIPALLFTFVTSAIVLPLLQLILMSLTKELDTRSSLLKYFRQQNQTSYGQQVADILLDLLVLMTFGMDSPLLGLLVVSSRSRLE